MAKRKDNKVNLVRNSILGVVALLVAGTLIYGLLYSTGVTEPDTFTEGTHYVVVDDPPRRRPTDPIVVTEFFSYGCIHCKNFDPLIEDWLETLPDGVEFKRTPVAFSPAWAMLGQAYLALESVDALQQNHQRIFRAIHDNGRQFATADVIGDFVDGRGVRKDEFLAAFNSTAVRRELASGDARQRKLGVLSVPTMVVADKYVVSMDVGRRVALDVVDHLVALESAPASGEAGSD